MLSNTKRQLLIEAAKRTLTKQGYALEKVPGRGKSNIWRISKNGKTQITSIRTTTNRWFAFPPLNGGSGWKTLDGSDIVTVATFDDPDKPTAIETYIFPAHAVQRRFKEAYDARIEAGNAVVDGFGMWVSLDKDERNVPASIGSGIIDEYPLIAAYAVEDFITTDSNLSEFTESEILIQNPYTPKTIAEVIAWAREHVATIAGVNPEAVKLDLKIEY